MKDKFLELPLQDSNSLLHVGWVGLDEGAGVL